MNTMFFSLANLCPCLVSNIEIKFADKRILYLNPEYHDWITINEKYKSIFDLFNGENSLRNILNHIREKFSDESELLISQVTALVDKAKIFSHNTIGQEQRLCKKKIQLKSVYLTLTDDCNLNCRYCYTTERNKSEKSNLYEWISYVNKVLSVSKEICFVFTGGEPLLVPFIFDLAEYISEQGCNAIMLTNGTCVSNAKIAEKIARYFIEIRVSLDSCNPKTNDHLRGIGVFKKVESAIALLNEAKANVIVQATVTQINKDEIAQFASCFNKRVNFQPLYEMGLGKECPDLKISGVEYYEALSRAGVSGYRDRIHSLRCNPAKRCAMAIEELSIAPNGDLYPCHMLHYPEFKIGNLKQDDMHRLYYNSPLLKKLRDINVDTIEQCMKCEVRNFCGGGCRARIDFKKLGLRGSDSFCVFERNSILEALIYSYG